MANWSSQELSLVLDVARQCKDGSGKYDREKLFRLYGDRRQANWPVRSSESLYMALKRIKAGSHPAFLDSVDDKDEISVDSGVYDEEPKTVIIAGINKVIHRASFKQLFLIYEYANLVCNDKQTS